MRCCGGLVVLWNSRRACTGPQGRGTMGQMQAAARKWKVRLVGREGEARDNRQSSQSREMDNRWFGRLRLAGRRRPKVTWG